MACRAVWTAGRSSKKTAYESMCWIQWVQQASFSFFAWVTGVTMSSALSKSRCWELRKSSYLPDTWFSILESLNLTSWHNCKMCGTVTVNCHVWTAIITLNSQICKRQTSNFQTTYGNIYNHLPSYPLNQHKNQWTLLWTLEIIIFMHTKVFFPWKYNLLSCIPCQPLFSKNVVICTVRFVFFCSLCHVLLVQLLAYTCT